MLYQFLKFDFPACGIKSFYSELFLHLFHWLFSLSVQMSMPMEAPPLLFKSKNKCKNLHKMLIDLGMEVPKTIETRKHLHSEIRDDGIRQ